MSTVSIHQIRIMNDHGHTDYLASLLYLPILNVNSYIIFPLDIYLNSFIFNDIAWDEKLEIMDSRSCVRLRLRLRKSEGKHWLQYNTISTDKMQVIKFKNPKEWENEPVEAFVRYAHWFLITGPSHAMSEHFSPSFISTLLMAVNFVNRVELNQNIHWTPSPSPSPSQLLQKNRLNGECEFFISSKNTLNRFG